MSDKDKDTHTHPFLSKHVPSQISNTQKLCYRHRPDLVKNRGPDEFIHVQAIQSQMEKLATSDQEAISHIWSLFAAAPADQRTLILKGIVSTCCMPQLSFLHNVTKPLLRIDFISILPIEVVLSIFSYLDATSLCHAAQVSQTWKKLADDDSLWHRMCEQHIDKKCAKCGWGLPLLDKTRSQAVRKRPLLTPIQLACGPSLSASEISSQDASNSKRRKSSHHDTAVTTSLSQAPIMQQQGSTPPPTAIAKRPWKDVYSERLVVERNWRNNNHTLLTLQGGHTDGVMCVQFDEILKIVVTGSFDKTVCVWDLDTGALRQTLRGHSRCVRALQFDDAKLVTGAMDNTLKIWNYQTGQCIRTLEGHTGGVLSLHFDSRILASGSTDHTIRLWNFQVGECYTLSGHTEWVNSVRICHQGTMLVSSSDDATVRLWDLQTRTCTRVYRGHVGQVQVALPSPHGFRHRLDSNTADINAFNHTSSSLASASTSSSTTISSISTPLQQQQQRIGCAASNNTTNLNYNATSSPSNVEPFPSSSNNTLHHKKSIEASDAPIIISSALDNTIKVWNTATGACLKTLFGHVQGIWGLAFDKLRIVSGSHDKTIRVWDTETATCLYALEGHHGPVTAIALSDTKIISASDDGQVKIWDFGFNNNEKNRPSAIDTTTQAETWPPHLDVLNQIMTPVQLLNDSSLQQELDFYTRAQFKLADTSNTTVSATSTAATTPIVTATTGNASYFDSLNIPSDQHQDYNTNQYVSDSTSYASLLFNSQQQQPNHSNDGSLLLAHEPKSYQQQNTLHSLYSNSSTPANSTPNSPIVHIDAHHQQQHYVEQNQDSDRFAAMFLSSSSSTSAAAVPSLANVPNEPWTNKGKKNATQQKFRFKQDTKQQQQHQLLDSKLLSKHNMEQDKKSGIKRPPKNKQKAPISTSSKKKQLSRNKMMDSDEDSQDDSQDEDHDEDGEDGQEDAPVIGDGALSYSSMGSSSSRASQPLTKDDKRRRNTAASARFRIKKKMREQALQNTACEMTDKALRMEQRVHELEREIKWLKALVVEKSQVRIEQLVRERPPNSTAFPSLNNSHAVASSSTSTSAASSSSRNKNQIMMMMTTSSNDQQQDDVDRQDDERRSGKGRHHGSQRRRF
ncbi:E3 ubiquitin ligase complex SCF subunit sconB [Mucor ambiguus]|uniref:E3 ubiquitin ligase complex SCF subunit sconB n=1 Tax=Mucor ambiguus TaxID=91626 RepID=A0A0C9MNU1_9FUNG|nr:E3 ubiquitin ligase complex SCF subunit sconB [Mucor ambiguus]